MPTLRGQEPARVAYRYLSVVYDAVRPLFVGTAATRDRYFQRLDLDADDRVLDVGCGTGVSTRRLAADARDVHGVDLSRPQLRRANARVDASLALGDATRLPYRDDAFDAVVSIGTLPYVPEPATLLEEARRVAAPGARLLAVGPKRPAPGLKRRLADAAMTTLEPADVRATADAAGWRDVDCEPVHMDWLARDALVVTARA
ncbi:MAG: class I SAM-dependent methyltransferase [Halobacterium sp.]